MAQSRMLLIDGVQTETKDWPKAAYDAVVSEQAKAKAAAEASLMRQPGVTFGVGPSGTMVIGGVNSRGVSLYHAQALRLFTPEVFKRANDWLAKNVQHLATRDAAGRDQHPRVPMPNYNGGAAAKAAAAEATAAPTTLADRAEAAAAATMAARDAADTE